MALMKLNLSFIRRRRFHLLKQISSTVVDLFRRKTDLVEKAVGFDKKPTAFSGADEQT